MRAERQFDPWDGFVFILSVIGIAVVFAQTGHWVSPDARQILDTVDLILCAIFLGDFAHEVWKADDRLRYLRTWGIVDLASSIPVIGPLRLARAGRIFRIIRLLRAARSFKYIRYALMTRRAESAVLAACLWTFSIGVFSSLTILAIEPAASPITRPDHALMWSFRHAHEFRTAASPDRFTGRRHSEDGSGDFQCDAFWSDHRRACRLV